MATISARISTDAKHRFWSVEWRLEAAILRTGGFQAAFAVHGCPEAATPPTLSACAGLWEYTFFRNSTPTHMLKEFKEFALKGNLVDMAVAFVMGAAFTKLSGSFIEDLIMPIVGMVAGGADFSNRFIALSDEVAATSLEAAREQGAVWAYGNFITIAINFLIVAFVMFLVVKAINKAKKLAAREAAVAPAPAPSTEEQLLAEIRDLLKQRP